MESGGEKFKIIIPIDDSEHSALAFEWYASVLKDPQHHVILMHVADYPIMPVIDTVTMNSAMWDRKMELRKEDVQELKQRYMARMEQLGIEGEFKAMFGSYPGEMISGEADALGAKMIVMGCRGQGLIRRTIMGSVSDYVINHSPCPVLVHRR